MSDEIGKPSLSDVFQITGCLPSPDSVPLLGLPGAVNQSLGRVAYVTTRGPLPPLSRMLPKFLGGIAYFRMVRSLADPCSMWLLAQDVAHTGERPVGSPLAYWTDAQCETWIMQAFHGY